MKHKDLDSTSASQLHDLLKLGNDSDEAEIDRAGLQLARLLDRPLAWIGQAGDLRVWDLFGEAEFPIETLRAAKDMAREFRNDPTHEVPRKVATALYFATSAVGVLRYGDPITTLETGPLCDGFRWVTEQAWVPPALQETARDAKERLPDV